jgi:hypothetical protein
MTPLAARSAAGQATVELVGLLPLLALLGFTGFALLAAASADEHANQAAEAGALALLQDREPRAAARAALPAGARDDAGIELSGRRITVTVRPELPLSALERPLTATATADAGPEPPPVAAP